MTFIPILNTKGAKPPRPDAVRFRVFGGKRLDFVFSTAIATLLGWNIGDRIIVSLGVGDDAGKVLLSRGDTLSAGQKLGLKKRTVMQVTVTIPFVHGGFTRAQIAEGLAPGGQAESHAIQDGALLITMPRLRMRVEAQSIREVA